MRQRLLDLFLTLLVASAGAFGGVLIKTATFEVRLASVEQSTSELKAAFEKRVELDSERAIVAEAERQKAVALAATVAKIEPKVDKIATDVWDVKVMVAGMSRRADAAKESAERMAAVGASR